MPPPIKGSIIVANGNGAVTYLEPTSNTQVLCLDSNVPKGVKFIDVKDIIPDSIMKVSSSNRTYITSSSYNTIMSISVVGENLRHIKTIKVLSYKQNNNIDSYDVRIYDATNDQIIAESNFNNLIPIVNDLGTLSNLPNEEAVLEIQCKKNGGNNNQRVYALECTIIYT